MIVYRLKAEDGTYVSNRKSQPEFGPENRARLWKQRSHLTNHIRQIDKEYNNEYQRKNVVVETCEVEYEVNDSCSITVFIDAIERKKQEQKDAWQKRAEEHQKRERYKQFLALQKEFVGADEQAQLDRPPFART